MKFNYFAKMMLGFSLLGAFSACGPQEKPEELTQLEELRNSEETAVINGNAPESYKKCTDLTNKAIDAWQDGEQSKARTYAALGQCQYATARAQSKLKEAQKRQDTADAQIKEVTAKMETLKVQLKGLEESTQLIRTNIASLDTANVEQRIQMAITEQEKAKGVNADVSQKETFDKAAALLKEAGAKSASGKRAEAGGQAEEARLLFAKAYELAKPEFDKKQLSAQSAERQKTLFTEASAIAGPAAAGVNAVYTDMKSTVVIIPGAFEMNKAEILPIKQSQLQQLVDLAKKYADATITIDGYAQTRTKNHYEVSQRRCDAVRDFFVSNGIDYKRIMTTAKGKENPRYDEKQKNNRPLNDRVEIGIILP